MSPSTAPTRADFEALGQFYREGGQFYREGGLREMASPHVHYDDPSCPHPGCGHRMGWVDFELELLGDPEGVYKPLVRSWWGGDGFVGNCPACGKPIRFTTLAMLAAGPAEAHLPRLPENWAAVAPFG